MNQKKDIMARTYLVFLGIVAFSLLIAGRVLYLQIGEGNYWRSKAEKVQLRFEQVEAERGSIFSEAGHVLSTSVPEFDIYIDFKADGLVENEGRRFHDNIDSLSKALAVLFEDRPAATYKLLLKKGFREGQRFFLLKRKVSYEQYQQMKELPLVKEGKNKSGFIAEARMKRLYPFGLMANRTIGLARDSNMVGIEKQYNSYLKGANGKRLVRYIAGGAGVPVEGSDIDPVDGCDIITTIDVNVQDMAQRALQRMMLDNDAERGTCIVMEVKTGKVVAIANLGKQDNGQYYEDYNYALSNSEPGSTWKLVTLLAALEDKKVSLETIVNLEGGKWQVAGQTVYDSEIHGMHDATVQKAFEKSSNVGMAKLAYQFYQANPSAFLKHISRLHLDIKTGIDLPGEAKPVIYKPGSKYWSKTTLPWMGFGYNLSITPLHTAMLYSAVANGGKMMKPYVVKRVIKDGEVVHENQPLVLNDSICSKATLAALRTCLQGVVTDGTGRGLKSDRYIIAGKTGTSLVADKGIRYSDKVYQSSFAGFFPADNPQYTIVVVIRNKAHAPKFYGASVAGPVFKEVADQMYAAQLRQPFVVDSIGFVSNQHVDYGLADNRWINQLTTYMWPAAAASFTRKQGYGSLQWNARPEVQPVSIMVNEKPMPDLQGLPFKDALAICEDKKLLVLANGAGRVAKQSIAAGTNVKEGQKIQLLLQ